MEDIKQLEVGHYVFTNERWGTSLVRYQIDRVTPKQAFSGNTAFKREIEERGFFGGGAKYYVVRIIGGGTARLQTTELLSQYNNENIIKKAKRMHGEYKIHNIDVDQAKKIIEFYETMK